MIYVYEPSLLLLKKKFKNPSSRSLPLTKKLATDLTSLPIGHRLNDDASPEIRIYDPQNPHSLINKVEDSLRESILGIPPKLLELTERQLRKLVVPDETLCRLKISFWDEYNRAVASGVRMNVSRVVRGVCNREYFYTNVVPNPKFLAWVATPPVDHLLAMREILDLGLNRLREIIKTPVYNVVEKYKDGELVSREKTADAAVMGQINKAVSQLMDRVHGSVIQKTAALNVNIDRQREQQALPTTIEEIEALEAELTGPGIDSV